MSPNDIKHFLVVYDLAVGEASVREFGTDYDTALAAYAEAERDFSNRDVYDIVLIGSDRSRRSSARTSYFHTEDSFESLLLAGLLS